MHDIFAISKELHGKVHDCKVQSCIRWSGERPLGNENIIEVNQMGNKGKQIPIDGAATKTYMKKKCPGWFQFSREDLFLTA
jgi:hypothetical protein